MIRRPRIRIRGHPFDRVGRLLVALIAAATAFYGVMIVLLSVKVSPSTVNSISGYRSVYGFLARLGGADLTGGTRAIVAGAGLLALLAFGYLALKTFPRAATNRPDLDLSADDRGTVTVRGRAVERLAEFAAGSTAGIDAATSRFDTSGLHVALRLARARGAPETLHDAHDEIHASLRRHGLAEMPVHVTLTAHDSSHRRDLH